MKHNFLSARLYVLKTS